MKINRWAVGIATVAILATSGAVTAFAAAPPYDPDPNAYGTVIFYDAAGNVITSGDGAVPESPKFAVSSADPVTAITNKRANLSLYGPQPLVDPGLWGGVQLNTNTVYPLLPTLTTPATTIPGSGCLRLTPRPCSSPAATPSCCQQDLRCQPRCQRPAERVPGPAQERPGNGLRGHLDHR